MFSKSAPLLAAASELAYYTVQCSALNAEELRRERGLEVSDTLRREGGRLAVIMFTGFTQLRILPTDDSNFLIS